MNYLTLRSVQIARSLGYYVAGRFLARRGVALQDALRILLGTRERFTHLNMPQ